MVSHWRQAFIDGRTIHDEQRSGRPSTALDPNIVEEVRRIEEMDRRLSLDEKFKWDVFGHPPYSPDLAPSDFCVYPQLKQHLGEKRFENENDLNEEVESWLSGMVAECYDAGLKKLLA